jgi:hypothetical protein
MRVALKMNKEKVQMLLDVLPFGFGTNFVISLIKWFLDVFIYQKPILNFRKKQFAKHEANCIELELRRGAFQITLVYDNYVSPPTYGDYLYVILLGRYFVAQGRTVNFLIVDSEYRDDWCDLTGLEKEKFVSDQVILAEALLDSAFAKIERVSWDNAQKRIDASASEYFPFRDLICKKVAIYNHCFNLLNQLLLHKDYLFLKRILFSHEQISSKVVISEVGKKYVTLACRYSKKWAFNRNMSDKEFLSLCERLRQTYPHHATMIVSDHIGCDYFSQLAQKNNLDILFSNKYSQSFLGDGALVLGSEFFVQVRGGGIAIFPMFSTVPYEIVAPLHNEVMWSKSKVLSFQNATQLFFNRPQ